MICPTSLININININSVGDAVRTDRNAIYFYRFKRSTELHSERWHSSMCKFWFPFLHQRHHVISPTPSVTLCQDITEKVCFVRQGILFSEVKVFRFVSLLLIGLTPILFAFSPGTCDGELNWIARIPYLLQLHLPKPTVSVRFYAFRISIDDLKDVKNMRYFDVGAVLFLLLLSVPLSHWIEK